MKLKSKIYFAKAIIFVAFSLLFVQPNFSVNPSQAAKSNTLKVAVFRISYGGGSNYFPQYTDYLLAILKEYSRIAIVPIDDIYNSNSPNRNIFGAQVIVAGTLSSFNKGFSITLKVINPKTGELLFQITKKTEPLEWCRKKAEPLNCIKKAVLERIKWAGIDIVYDRGWEKEE